MINEIFSEDELPEAKSSSALLAILFYLFLLLTLFQFLLFTMLVLLAVAILCAVGIDVYKSWKKQEKS